MRTNESAVERMMPQLRLYQYLSHKRKQAMLSTGLRPDGGPAFDISKAAKLEFDSSNESTTGTMQSILQEKYNELHDKIEDNIRRPLNSVDSVDSATFMKEWQVAMDDNNKLRLICHGFNIAAEVIGGEDLPKALWENYKLTRNL